VTLAAWLVTAALAASQAAPPAAAPPRANDDTRSRPESPTPQLWLYSASNLLVDANVEKLAALFERAGKAGYAKVLLADSKFARLGTLDARYFKNVERVKAAAKHAKLELVPAVFPIGYSEGILFHDPNLAEAMHVRMQPFVVEHGRAHVVPDVRVLAQPKWKDDVWRAEPGGWRCKDAGDVNARVVFELELAPEKQYHLACTIETTDFAGEPRVQVLGRRDRGLTFSDLGCKRTQPPTRHHVVFHSQGNGPVRVYLGAWGAGKGELAISDVVLEECGLVNLVRRDGAPLRVALDDGSNTRVALEEGKDFEPVVDPHLGNVPWPGSFDVWHEPPTIATKKLADGTRLLVDYYAAVVVGSGQVMICPSEPKTLELLRDEAKRVHALFGEQTHDWFLSHDEIRVLNQDASCQLVQASAGEVLADHVEACLKIVREVDHDARPWIWSDMFDPNHNAHDDYYLVNGSLAGSWEGLDRDVGIAAWYFEKRDASLDFFAKRGHRRFLLAAYYDVRSDALEAQLKGWLDAADQVGGATAVMYTTWQSKFDELERFAQLVRAH
jgi:hypothetical protein